jgi:hypothetical protein
VQVEDLRFFFVDEEGVVDERVEVRLFIFAKGENLFKYLHYVIIFYFRNRYFQAFLGKRLYRGQVRLCEQLQPHPAQRPQQL